MILALGAVDFVAGGVVIMSLGVALPATDELPVAAQLPCFGFRPVVFTVLILAGAALWTAALLYVMAEHWGSSSALREAGVAGCVGACLVPAAGFVVAQPEEWPPDLAVLLSVVAGGVLLALNGIPAARWWTSGLDEPESHD